jgi:predicted Zn-dependent peptidase
MYKKIELKNGLELITAPIEGTKTATVFVIVRAGSKNENKNNNGVSHFLEHVFFKGTEKRPDTLSISSELDSIGAEFNAFTTKEFTGFWVKVDSSRIEFAVDILSDMLQNSKFDSSEIEREKGVIIEEVNMYQDNPMMYIEDVFESCLYGDTPAGREIIGTKENILNFKREDFINYIKDQYSSKNIKICVTGNIDNNIEDLIKKYFIKFNNFNSKEKLNTIENQSEPQVKVHYKKIEQANLAFGVRTFPIEHKDEVILKVLGIILGGSMSSRLFINLRERNSLAYYIRTQSEFYSDTGYLVTFAGVPADRIDEAIQIISNEYKKIKEELVLEEELRRVKDMIKGKSIIQLESSDNVANWYAKQSVLRKNISTPEEYFEELEKVTSEDIKRVANEIFISKGLNLAVIGPFKDKEFDIDID